VTGRDRSSSRTTGHGREDHPRHRGDGPRPWRRADKRLFDTSGWRPGHRQEHALLCHRRKAFRSRGRRPVCIGRGIVEAACGEEKTPGLEIGVFTARDKSARRHPGSGQGEGLRLHYHRFHPIDLQYQVGFSAGEREPDQGCQLKTDQGAEAAGNQSHIHRACHKGRGHRRTKDTGAHGRYGALLRGRQDDAVPHAPGP